MDVFHSSPMIFHGAPMIFYQRSMKIIHRWILIIQVALIREKDDRKTSGDAEKRPSVRRNSFSVR
jgi:hypothetical protein